MCATKGRPYKPSSFPFGQQPASAALISLTVLVELPTMSDSEATIYDISNSKTESAIVGSPVEIPLPKLTAHRGQGIHLRAIDTLVDDEDLKQVPAKDEVETKMNSSASSTGYPCSQPGAYLWKQLDQGDDVGDGVLRAAHGAVRQELTKPPSRGVPRLAGRAQDGLRVHLQIDDVAYHRETYTGVSPYMSKPLVEEWGWRGLKPSSAPLRRAVCVMRKPTTPTTLAWRSMPRCWRSCHLLRYLEHNVYVDVVMAWPEMGREDDAGHVGVAAGATSLIPDDDEHPLRRLGGKYGMARFALIGVLSRLLGLIILTWIILLGLAFELPELLSLFAWPTSDALGQIALTLDTGENYVHTWNWPRPFTIIEYGLLVLTVVTSGVKKRKQPYAYGPKIPASCLGQQTIKYIGIALLIPGVLANPTW
ncbi:hypothetical protein F5884DRAFT_905839, partial [Xylogone sp. PMI_703]